MAFSDMILIAQEKQSFLHGLDPRTKLCLVMTVMILPIVLFNLFLLLILFLIILCLVLFAKVFHIWLNTMKGIFFLAALVFLLNTLIYGYIEAPKPIKWLNLDSWITIFNLGLERGILLSLRLLSFSGIVILFVLTTDLEEFGITLRKMKFPYEFVFIIVAIARFIPVLIDDTETIMKARMVKGIEFQRGGLLTKIRRYARLLVPLVIVSLRRSSRLAEAMDARGFGAVKKRTFYTDVNMRTRDWILSGIFIVILVIGILNRLSIFRMPL